VARSLTQHAPRHLAIEDRSPAVAARPPFHGMAIAALVMGIAGIPLFFSFEVAPLLAVVFGAAGLSQIRRSHGSERGKAIAIAGIALGAAGIALGVAAVLSGHAGSLDPGHLLG